jgi:ATP-binding cassette, subfamily B, bacterial
MSFILDGLETETYDRTYSDRDLTRRIVGYFRPHRAAMVLVAGVLAISSFLDALAPIAVSWAIDLVATRSTTLFIALLGLALIGVGSLAWLFNFVRQRVANRVVGDVVLQLRSDIFRHAVNHDMSFFDEHPVGRIVSRITSDTQDFSNTVTLVIDFMSQVLVVVFLTVYLMTINWWLTVVLLAMAPVAASIALSFRRLARRVTLDAKRATSTINAHIQESFGGIGVAKAYRQEQRLYDHFERNNRLAYRVGLRRGLVLNLIFPLVGIAAGVGTGAVLYIGGLGVNTAPAGSWLAGILAGAGEVVTRAAVVGTEVAAAGAAAGTEVAVLGAVARAIARAGAMTPGEWYLFLQAVGFFWWPMLGIASFFSQFQDGLGAAERVFALIDAEPSVRQTGSTPGGDGGWPRVSGENRPGDGGWSGDGGAGEKVASRMQGGIEFRSLSFAYSRKETVLEDFSLRVAPGETVALVGHTGAGKSSIARLITRFYEFQAGTILVDGTDIRSLDLRAYRRQIGLVPQSPFLFTGTVRDNIRYALPDAPEERVVWAASHVGRGDWLEDLPNGLDTEVGERGSAISLGQRQLVALARVLLKDPAIFILDEATASVDPFTEAQIQEGLDSVMDGRTAIVIAHRLSTVKSADRIIVLDGGRIVEDGTHQALLDSGGQYANLYNTYFRHQSLDYVPPVVGD